MGIKHTPGPWVVDIGSYIGCTDEHYHSITAGCGYHVGNQDDGFELSGCMSAANAHLIAAAPELLEALSDALIDFDNWAAHEDNHPHEHLVAWAEKARAAIAKAKGEEK